jgi:periplasmic protein TonB
LFFSLSARNIYLISGVLISHVLLLLFLVGSFGFTTSSEPGILLVGLNADKLHSTTNQKSSVSSPKSMSSIKESQSSIQVSEDASHVSFENAEPVASGRVRQAIFSPKPHYPLISRKLREQGLVVVRLCVNKRGEVGEIDVAKTSGHLSLDRSALATLSQWKFMPIVSSNLRSGPEIDSQCFQTPVQFSLEG